MSKDHNIKFYPPIWEKLKDAPNKNFLVNYAVGVQYGIPAEIIEAYARQKKEEKYDNTDTK